jgi:hypothetical protein
VPYTADEENAELCRERLRPPAEEVGEYGDHTVRSVRPLADPITEKPAEPREGDDERAEERGRQALGALDARGEGRVRGEREDELADGVALRSQQLVEEMGTSGRGDDGEAEAAERR